MAVLNFHMMSVSDCSRDQVSRSFLSYRIDWLLALSVVAPLVGPSRVLQTPFPLATYCKYGSGWSGQVNLSERHQSQKSQKSQTTAFLIWYSAHSKGNVLAFSLWGSLEPVISGVAGGETGAVSGEDQD